MHHSYDRSERLISLFRELGAAFISQEANPSPLITVTGARVSRDLGHVTIFVTVYPEKDEEQALHFLKRKGSDFRSYVKQRGNLKTIPFFEFSIDYGERHRQHIDAIANP